MHKSLLNKASMTGAKLADRYTLPEIWFHLHNDASLLEELIGTQTFYQDLLTFNNRTLSSLKLMNSVNPNDWHSLCQAAGMTVYGAVALSWCEGAELSQVWEGWEASGFLLKPSPEYERPARFINPALLPDTTSLKELSAIAENKSIPLCAMIVALQDKPLNFDMTPTQMKSANPQIASFLKSRMERKKSLTDEERELITHWGEAVKGTEYEV